MEHQVAALDATFDNIGTVKTVWITVSNYEKKDHLQISLELNGVRKVIQEHFILGMSDQGIILHSSNLSGHFAR